MKRTWRDLWQGEDRSFGEMLFSFTLGACAAAVIVAYTIKFCINILSPVL